MGLQDYFRRRVRRHWLHFAVESVISGVCSALLLWVEPRSLLTLIGFSALAVYAVACAITATIRYANQPTG
jgi:hypothetical protein